MEVMPDMEAMPVWDTLVWDMLPMDTLLPSLLSMLPPLWLLLPPLLLPITATPRSPPLLPSPLLVPPLLLSPLSEDSMPELDVMSPTPPVLSMLPRGRLRLIPMSSDTTDWDMEVMPDMEAMPVWDTLVWDTPVWDMLPMDTLPLSLLSMLPPLWLLPPLLLLLLPPSLLPITATPRFPPLLPSPPLVP